MLQVIDGRVSLNHIHVVEKKLVTCPASSKEVPKSVMACLAVPLIAAEMSASPFFLP